MIRRWKLTLARLVGAALLMLTAGRVAWGAGPAVTPASHDYSYAYDLLNQSFFRPFTRFLDPALLARKVAGKPREAANVDANDEVHLPSTWWQPRVGFRVVTVERMLEGPGTGVGPAPGPWTVTAAKTQGVTPGFQIEDSKGDKFIIKFDTPVAPEAATGADVIGSYLFWAAGYNVPENTIEYFRPSDLEVSPKAKYTDSHHKKRPMSREYLDGLLARVAPAADGRYRCVASRYLSGKPLGPFEYSDRRRDDPEDMIPHELRRELRGLWTVAAWTNHADSRGPNTLDMYVKDGGRTFVRHYLIDFGSILGSNAAGFARERATGWEYYVDYGVATRRTALLGLHKSKWEKAVDPNIPAVGFVESRMFDGKTWRPDMPNPAFDERTLRDARWGARIVGGFTDEHIKAAVAAAQYSDPRASEYLTRTLIERRDKLVARWLGTLPPVLSSVP